jgi:hypothetical protein
VGNRKVNSEQKLARPALRLLMRGVPILVFSFSFVEKNSETEIMLGAFQFLNTPGSAGASPYQRARVAQLMW